MFQRSPAKPIIRPKKPLVGSEIESKLVTLEDLYSSLKDQVDEIEAHVAELARANHKK